MATHVPVARRCLRFAVVVLLGVMPPTLRAQAPPATPRIPTTFDQLSVQVATGQKVTVTNAAGERYTGRITDLSSTKLSLKVGSDLREFGEADVSTLRQRRDDTLRNGALWGLASGGAVGIAACGTCHIGPGLVAAGIYGGIGAGLGVGIDALIRKEVTIFQRPGSAGTKVSLAPQLSPSHKAVAVSVTF